MMPDDTSWKHKAFALFVFLCLFLELFSGSAGLLWIIALIWGIAQYL